MFKLIYKTILVLIVALLLSLGVDYFYRQAYGLEYAFPSNILPKPEINEKYKIVKLGNSHSEEGLTFERYNVKSLNLASVAQRYAYDLALLKMYHRQIEENAVIIINVSPMAFSQKAPKNESEVNTQYYDGRLSPFLIPGLNIAQYLEVQIIPFVRTGYLWRTRYASDTKEKAMGGYVATMKKNEEKVAAPKTIVTSPQRKTVRKKYVRSEDPSYNVNEIHKELNAPPATASGRIVDSTEFVVHKWNNPDGFSTESFAANRKELQDIIDYCREQNWRPVLVTLPLNQVLLDRLGEGYLDRYVYSNLEQVDTGGIRYINFTLNRQLAQNKFLYADADHLNRKGALITGYLLLQELIGMQYLPKEADGYDYTPFE